MCPKKKLVSSFGCIWKWRTYAQCVNLHSHREDDNQPRYSKPLASLVQAQLGHCRAVLWTHWYSLVERAIYINFIGHPAWRGSYIIFMICILEYAIYIYIYTHNFSNVSLEAILGFASLQRYSTSLSNPTTSVLACFGCRISDQDPHLLIQTCMGWNWGALKLGDDSAMIRGKITFEASRVKHIEDIWSDPESNGYPCVYHCNCNLGQL